MRALFPRGSRLPERCQCRLRACFTTCERCTRASKMHGAEGNRKRSDACPLAAGSRTLSGPLTWRKILDFRSGHGNFSQMRLLSNEAGLARSRAVRQMNTNTGFLWKWHQEMNLVSFQRKITSPTMRRTEGMILSMNGPKNLNYPIFPLCTVESFFLYFLGDKGVSV